MMEVEGDQNLFDGGQGHSFLDRFFSELVQGNPPHLHHSDEFLGGIGSVVPEMDVGVGASSRPGVFIADESEPFLGGAQEDLFQGGVLVRSGGEVRVAVANPDLVPIADPVRIGLPQLDVPVLIQLDYWMGVVHDGISVGSLLSAGDVVVAQPDGMPHLVGGELADPLQGHLPDLVGVLVPVDVRRGQTLTDQPILPDTEGPKRDVALEDLTGPGVDDGVPVAPSPGRAVNPLDHVVPGVHGVGVGRKDLHLESVDESSGLEGLIPPPGPLQKGGPHGLGSARDPGSRQWAPPVRSSPHRGSVSRSDAGRCTASAGALPEAWRSPCRRCR